MSAKPKSSITLPPDELKLVTRLRKLTSAKSNVEVVRRGLRLLEKSMSREELRNRFITASEKVSLISKEERQILDKLNSEGLENED